MKKINHTLKIILSFAILLVFCCIARAQDNDSTDVKGAGSYDDETLSYESGYWMLTGTNTLMNNKDGHTVWNGIEGSMKGLKVWTDFYKIEHTVNSGFRWDSPPNRMEPESECHMMGYYENIEYSTIDHVQTGIEITINKSFSSGNLFNRDLIEIVKTGKELKSRTYELTNGSFTAPRLHRTDRKLRLYVDCFIGNDHYITVYTYSWVKN